MLCRYTSLFQARRVFKAHKQDEHHHSHYMPVKSNAPVVHTHSFPEGNL